MNDANDKPLRVWAVFGNYYPNFSGTAVQGRQMMRLLAPNNVTSFVLTAADHKARKLAGQTVTRDGLEIRYLRVIGRRNWSFLHRFPKIHKVFRFGNVLLSDFSFTLGVIRVLWREGQPGDILHFHSFGDFTFIVERLARAWGIRSVILMTLVGSTEPTAGKGILRWFKRQAFQQADSIISISTAMTDSCRKVGIEEKKVSQIPCGVDLDKFFSIPYSEKDRLKERLKLPAGRRYVIFVGAALARKGIDTLISAFIQVAGQLDNTDLLIVGPNDFSDHTRHDSSRQALVQQLKQELAEDGLEDRVHWIGEVNNTHEYLQVADLFCFPTRREGFGIVIVEAMATSLPLIVGRIEGVTTDIITNVNEGDLLDTDSPDEYAEALLRVLCDQELAQNMGRSARQRAEEVFSLEQVAQQHYHLYLQLASRGGS